MGDYTRIKCSTCGKVKSQSEFYFRKDRDRYDARCKKCVSQKNKERYHNNLEKYRKINRDRQRERRKDPKVREKNRAYHIKLKRDVLARFGEKCVKCDFNDWRALEVDHKKGNGRRDRERFDSNSAYRRYLLELPERELFKYYQCLCSNCNSIKIYEKNELRRIKYG